MIRQENFDPLVSRVSLEWIALPPSVPSPVIAAATDFPELGDVPMYNFEVQEIREYESGATFFLKVINTYTEEETSLTIRAGGPGDASATLQ